MVSGMETNNNSNNINTDSNAIPSPQSVGREFVRQYYTILNRGPQLLHRFYSDDSSFVHGGLDKPGEVSVPVFGQENINKKIISLDFKDCHAKIRQVDSMETIGKGVVIQVTGELSNNGQPMRKFLQTFVLAPQSSTKYYAKNDIFRYQDDIFLDDDEYSEVEKNTDVGSERTEVPPLKSVDREEKEVREDSNVSVGTEYYENTNGSVHEINVEKLSINNDPTDDKSTEINSTDNFEDESYLKNEEFVDRNSTSPQPQTNEMKTYANMVSKNPNATFPPFSSISTFTTVAKSETNSVSVPYTRPVESSPIPSMASVNNSISISSSSVSGKPPSNNSGGPPKENRVRRERQQFNRRNESREMTPGRVALNDSDDDFREKKQYPDENQVFVGNLPQHIVEDHLRDLFTKYGKILDVRINRQNQKLSSNAKTPNYGFVTFESPDIVQQILKQKPIYFDGHRFNVEEKRSQTGRGGSSSFRDSNRGNMGPNRSQMGSSGNQRNRNQFSSGNSGPRGGDRSGSGGGGGFGNNRNSSMRQNR